MFTNQYVLFTVALVLAIIAALNLGYLAWNRDMCNDDLVHTVVPHSYARWVYGAVGVAGIVLAFLVFSRNIYGQRASVMKVPGDVLKSLREGGARIVKTVKRK